MSKKFDNQIEELNKFTNRNYIKKFVHVKDFDSFKKSIEELNNSVNTLGNSESEQKCKECVEWVMERVNKWNMAIDNFHIVNKLKELLPLLNQINENLPSAEDARLAKEAQDARLAQETRLAKEAQDARLAQEARLAKAAHDARLAEETRLAKEAEEEKNESFAKSVLKAQLNNEDIASSDSSNDVVEEKTL